MSNETGCSIAGGIFATYVNGVKNFNFENAITLSPNPSKDELFINGHWLNGKTKITICNILGEEVYSDQLQTFNNNIRTSIDVSGFSKGVYMMKVQMLSSFNNSGYSDGAWIGKFVKE